MRIFRFPPRRPSFLLALMACLLAFLDIGHSQNPGSVIITFKNTSTRKITLNSAAPGQALKPMAEVPPGASKSMQSVPGQNWILLNPGNRVVTEYKTTADARQVFTITQDGGAGVPAPVAGGAPQPQVPARPAPATAAGAGSKLSTQQIQQIVAYHNQKRAEVGSGNVTWSPQIAQFAQGRADTIARTKQFAHLAQGQNPYGENLAQGGGSGGTSGYTVINACDGWYAEKAKMPNNARTFSIDLFNRGVGHYTQMVWKGSTQIGAGIAQYQNGGFTWTVVVCCYNPTGNVINQAIY